MKVVKELTLALLKPDLAINPKLVSLITHEIKNHGFDIQRKKTVKWNSFDAEQFYSVHKGRFFYPRLVEYMSSGPIIAMVLSKENAIREWRNLMGPTKTYKTRHLEQDSLRGRFGLTDTRNTTHGSDSPENALQEINFFFPDFNSNKKSTGKLKSENSYHTLGLVDTWQTHYALKESESTEWFVPYLHIKDHVAALLNNLSDARVLDVGCGDSLIGPNIAKDFPTSDVFCGDVSIDALYRLQDATSEHKAFDDVKNFRCVHMDATQEIPINEIDLIIDKGFMDAILRQPKGLELSELFLRNSYSALGSKGAILQISDEAPEVRLDVLQDLTSNLNFNISCKEINGPGDIWTYFSYYLRKS